MQLTHKITPCLWFDNEAEEAAHFYVSVFEHSKILHVTRYGEAGRQVHGREAGAVMTVAFELDGQTFTALNGGPVFHFNEAISFQIDCTTQDEVDYYWEQLSAGGDRKAQRCGWLKDRYGLFWQVVPEVLRDMLADAESERAQRVMSALLDMKKIEIEALRRAFDG